MQNAAELIAVEARRRGRELGVRNATKLAAIADDNIRNRAAVKRLEKMGEGGRARYLCYGDDPKLGKTLPGVKIHVLGPPDLTQSQAITKMRQKDQEQYWHLGVQTLRALSTPAASARAPSAKVPSWGRWFRRNVDDLRKEQLFEFVRTFDDLMNNTSLILLFEIGDKKLLFPGDAQWECWSHCFAEAEKKPALRQLLNSIDFYKVGHHGSLNATPKKALWEQLKRLDGKNGGLISMLSSKPGVHPAPGKKSHGKNTEVPRKTLVSELGSRSTLHDTETMNTGLKKTPPSVVVSYTRASAGKYTLV